MARWSLAHAKFQPSATDMISLLSIGIGRCGLAGQRSECNHKPFTDNYTRSKDNINTPARDSALAGDLCIYQQEDHPQPRFTVLVRQDTARHHHHKPLWRQYMVCGLGCVPALQQGS
jgi:hypothetical protein